MTDEKTYQHRWATIQPFRKDEAIPGAITRVDKCELCLCERETIKYKSRGHIRWYTQYYRSGIIFNEECPECWGGKNPL